jgi:SAM-dependent methyltransferase
MRDDSHAAVPETQLPETASGMPQALKIKTRCCIVTGRGISGYLTELGIRAEQLKFKKGLDIGPGEGMFVRACSELGVDIVGIDPIYGSVFGKGHNDFMEDEQLKWITEGLRYEGRPVSVVAGVNEALPFKDEAFDYVLGSRSSIEKVSVNYPEPEEMELALRKMLVEIVRVLKPGGEARMTCLEGMRDLIKEELQEIASGHPSGITWEFLPGPMYVLVIRKRT